jgi:hypothetical protein
MSPLKSFGLHPKSNLTRTDYFGVFDATPLLHWVIMVHPTKFKSPRVLCTINDLYNSSIEAAFQRDKLIRSDKTKYRTEYHPGYPYNMLNFNDNQFSALLKLRDTAKVAKKGLKDDDEAVLDILKDFTAPELPEKAKPTTEAEQTTKELLQYAKLKKRELIGNPTIDFKWEGLGMVIDNKADEKKSQIVDEAVLEIKKLYIKNAQQAYLDIAEYLAKTFFNNKIELIKAKKPAGDMAWSYNAVIKALRLEKIAAPSKSWMYNALDLFTDRKLLEQGDQEVFHTYGNLPVSHQIKLITVKNIDKKAELINKTANEKLTVIKLQQELDKLTKKKKPKNTYRKELEAVEKFLEKRLASVKVLSKKEKKKIDDYTQVEEFLQESIERG